MLLLDGKQFADLRAVAGTTGGLRIGAYPSAMPLLVKMKLVEERLMPIERHGEGRAWFLTPEGRVTVRVYGSEEV